MTNPVPVDTSGTVLERVRRHAEHAPEREAVHYAGTAVSYGKLTARIGLVAAELRAAGCRARDVVVCRGPRSLRTVVLFLALESIGAVYVPVDPAWPAARTADVLELSEGDFLVEWAADDGASPTVRRLRARPGSRGDVRDDERGPGTGARYVIFTSGTTGRPKGAVVEQTGMLNHLAAKVADLDLTSADRVAFTAPPAFDISIWQMLASLTVGGSVLIATDDDMAFPRRLRRLLGRHRASVLELVPTAVSALLDEAGRQSDEQLLPALRWLISTGEELRPRLASRVLAALPHAGLLNAYGPTECSDDVTHLTVTAAHVAGPRIPVGRPVGNAVLYLLVEDRLDGSWRAAEPGESGEIFVGGAPVGRGYLNDPAATGRAFFRDRLTAGSPTGRLYRTGDLGRAGADGMQYLGRVDRQVKVAGTRLELDEIEAIISRHPAVDQCAVTLVEREGRPEPAAHYTLRSPASAAQLEQFAQSLLVPSAVPRHWHRHDALPLTPHGKVNHRALSRAAGGGPHDPPRPDTDTTPTADEGGRTRQSRPAAPPLESSCTSSASGSCSCAHCAPPEQAS